MQKGLGIVKELYSADRRAGGAREVIPGIVINRACMSKVSS